MRENNITVLKVNHRIYPKQTRLRFGIYMFVESMYIRWLHNFLTERSVTMARGIPRSSIGTNSCVVCLPPMLPPSIVSSDWGLSGEYLIFVVLLSLSFFFQAYDPIWFAKIKISSCNRKIANLMRLLEYH